MTDSDFAEEAAAAPSGNAFASFAASNSKSGFGSMSADTAAASNSFGNGTSLGEPALLPCISALQSEIEQTHYFHDFNHMS